MTASETPLEEALDRSHINGYGEERRWHEHFQVVPYINDHPKAARKSPWIERHGGVVLRFKGTGFRYHVGIWYDRKEKRLFYTPPGERSERIVGRETKVEWFDIICIESHADRVSFEAWVCGVWEKAVCAAKDAGKPGCVPWQPKNTGALIFHDVQPDGSLLPNGRGKLPWECGEGVREQRRLALQGGVEPVGVGEGVAGDGGAARSEEVREVDPTDAAPRFE